MRRIRAWIVRVAGLFAGPRADAELAEELEAHLEMATAEYVRRGMTTQEARRQARLDSGGLAQAAEAVRDRRGVPWIEHIIADARYAVRSLAHSRGFTAVVIITLALGIGANTAIFSVIDGVLLKPLPHRDGERLVYLRHSTDAAANILFSVPEVRDFRAAAPAFAGIAEYCPWNGVLRRPEGAERLTIGLVTGNFFEVMGLHPAVGRLTRPSDDGPGVAPVMILTHDFWIHRFGGDSAIVGKQVVMDGNAITVIGVEEAAPSFPDPVDAWTNMVVSQHHLSSFMLLNRVHRMTEIVARLAPGATLDEARAQVAAIGARVRHDFPDAYAPGSHDRVAVLPFRQVMGESARTTLYLLMGAALFVLVIAGANVTNLTLMRGVRREPELVTRAALGAGVPRLRRLLLVENLVLTISGGALGLGLAAADVKLLIALAARYSPRANEIQLNAPVLGFALALSVLLALVLSFAAALPREGSLAAWIGAAGHRTAGNGRKQRLQRALVVAQVAVSVVLLAGAGLLTRTLLTLSEVNTGLVTENVLTLPLQVMNANRALRDPSAAVEAQVTYARLREELRGLPGVVEVGLGSTMPLRRGPMQFEINTQGKTPEAGAAVPAADFRTASPEYFRAAGIPVLRGRAFASGDSGVVVVNQEFARRYFPNEDPIGREIALAGPMVKLSPFSGDWRRIVGVSATTQDGGLDSVPRPAVFLPFAKEFPFFGGLVIRTAGDPAQLTESVTRIVRRIVPEAPLDGMRTVAQIKDASVAPRRLNAELISALGLLALMIAAVGIAGVLAFSVSTRTNEIGIRMSLGADTGAVERMILREGGALVAAGLILGLAGALAVTRLLRGWLFGVPPRDPVTFAAVTVAMAVIGLLACWLPALRAARIDPAITMRST